MSEPGEVSQNPYSIYWFNSFYHNVPIEWTEKDISAIQLRIPFPTFKKILDVGCGYGRISGPLSLAGYDVTGIDSFQEAIDFASVSFPDANHVLLDLLELDQLPENAFDAVLLLWHSFGYHSSVENIEILKSIQRRLRKGGIAVFDLFNPGFAKLHTGSQQTRGEGVLEVKHEVFGDRQISRITYNNGKIDCIEFQLFEPEDFAEILGRLGLKVLETLVFWESVEEINDGAVRYQLICEAS